MDHVSHLIVKRKAGSPIPINKDRVSLSQGLLLLFETLAPKPAPVENIAELSWQLTGYSGVPSQSPAFTPVRSVALLDKRNLGCKVWSAVHFS